MMWPLSPSSLPTGSLSARGLSSFYSSMDCLSHKMGIWLSVTPDPRSASRPHLYGSIFHTNSTEKSWKGLWLVRLGHVPSPIANSPVQGTRQGLLKKVRQRKEELLKPGQQDLSVRMRRAPSQEQLTTIISSGFSLVLS